MFKVKDITMIYDMESDEKSFALKDLTWSCRIRA